MAILKTRFERGTDVPLLANAFVRGGRLVRIVAAGLAAHKPRVEETTGPTNYAIGAAAVDAIAGQNVAVTHRGWMLLQSAGVIPFDSDVVPASGGRVQAPTGAAGERVFGRSMSGASAVDQLLWVKPDL